MPGAGDEAFEEDDAGAERPLGLVAGPLVRVGQVGVGGDHPDAAATTTGRRLEHQRVADLRGGRLRRLQGVHPATTPRRDRYADLLGDQLGADLVAEFPHRLGARTDEGHPDPGAQLGEVRVLGDEAPAHPRRVGLRLDQSTLEDGVVEVRPVRGRAEVVGEVRLPDEHRPPLTLGVQRYRLDPMPVGTRLGIEVTNRMDEPHRGFTTVDDGDTREHWVCLPPTASTRPRAGGISR